MARVEFFAYNNEVWYSENGSAARKMSETSDIIPELFKTIEEQYPEAMAALREAYSEAGDKIRYYQYLITRRFIKCNFSNIDDKFDLDEGRLVFEYVPCPLRGECHLEGLVCKPRFSSAVSDAELRVLELLYKGVPKLLIAEKLYLSQYTVENHIKHAYKKLGVHTEAEFVKYAESHDMFKPRR